MITDLHPVARQLQIDALSAVEPSAAVRRHMRREGNTLLVAGQRYALRDVQHVFVIGAGKASLPMTEATLGILGDVVSDTVIVTKYGHGRDNWSSHVIEAGHPIPDENSMRGAQAVADLARTAGADDLVICLVSGGASALLTLPNPGLSLADLQSLTDSLLRSGATIQELNTVRKHCSLIKGGNLASLASPALVVSLILSDVVGDPLDVIASGLTVPDPTTVTDAQAVLTKYNISPPLAVPLRETPKPQAPAFDRAQYVVIGSNRLAAEAAVASAQKLGFNALLLSTFVEGEAREVAKVAAALAKEVLTHDRPIPRPACLVLGGETTVTVTGTGRGGRNQELALAAAIALDGCPGVLLMALATDGTDGPTDAAGAVITGTTGTRARKLGQDPAAALRTNNSYDFFEALGDAICTGPTGTNVNDLVFILVSNE
jgi:glycerate 2-kinase